MDFDTVPPAALLFITSGSLRREGGGGGSCDPSRISAGDPAIRGYGTAGSGRQSFRFDPGEFHHLAPLLSIFCDEPAVVGWCPRKHSQSQILKLLLHFWISNDRVHFAV